MSFALIAHLPLWGWWQCGFSQLSSPKCRVSRRGQDEGGSDDFNPNQSKCPVLFDKSTPLVFALPQSWTNFNPEYWEIHVRHSETRSSKLFGDVRDHWDPSQPSIDLVQKRSIQSYIYSINFHYWFITILYLWNNGRIYRYTDILIVSSRWCIFDILNLGGNFQFPISNFVSRIHRGNTDHQWS